MGIEPYRIELPVVGVRNAFNMVIMAVHRVGKNDHIVPDSARPPRVTAGHHPVAASDHSFPHRQDSVFQVPAQHFPVRPIRQPLLSRAGENDDRSEDNDRTEDRDNDGKIERTHGQET